jgi:hypothetical protein
MAEPAVEDGRAEAGAAAVGDPGGSRPDRTGACAQTRRSECPCPQRPGSRPRALAKRARHRKHLGPGAGLRQPRLCRARPRGAGTRLHPAAVPAGHRLAELHPRDLQPGRGNRPGHQPHRRNRQGAEELHLHGSRADPVGRRARGPRQHPDHSSQQAEEGRHRGPRICRGPAGDPGLCQRAQPGLDQHHRQRHRCHGRQRHPGRQDPPRGSVDRRRDRGRRPRHPRRDPVEDIRPLLHHQGTGRGNRARAEHQPQPGGAEASRPDLGESRSRGRRCFTVRLPIDFNPPE